jgi:hypothetical protein
MLIDVLYGDMQAVVCLGGDDQIQLFQVIAVRVARRAGKLKARLQSGATRLHVANAVSGAAIEAIVVRHSSHGRDKG